MASIEVRIAGELGVKEQQVQAAVELLDGGATVPFIARYRKEATGSLDDTQLRTLEERLRYLRELEERRKVILDSIREQGKLDATLEAAIMAADSKGRLEDIYLPYKPKRRTKAEIAKEAGLEPLADLLLNEPQNVPAASAEPFVSADRNVGDVAAALEGARAILVERFAENADLIGALREELWTNGRLKSAVLDGKKEAGAKFSDYFEFSEALGKMPSHRVLALLRGEREEVLGLTIEPDDGTAQSTVSAYELRVMRAYGIADQGRPGDKWLAETVRWAWRTKILVTLSIDIRLRLWTAAEEEAVRVFAANLRDLLLAAPAGARTTLGLDPGFRTGVKVAVVDATGKVVDTGVIYPHEPQRRWDEALAIVAKLVRKHKVELIAIGNGTASRETEKLASELVKGLADLKLHKVVVSEAGASVYSASAYASEELPGLDVTLRGAVSIARRLQDPLAELVKIDPKSIGVGQYQHDLSEFKLSRSLGAVVEDCVNARGRGLEHGVGAAARACLGHRLGARAGHRVASRHPRTVPLAQGAEGCAAARPQGVRAVRRLPAHPRRRRSARRLGGASRVLSGGAPDPRCDEERHQGAGRQHLRPARAVARVLRRREVRPADRHRHPARTGEAGPRSAAGVQDRGVQGRRRDAGRSQTRHGARGCRSPTSRRSARSSTSACTRTGWCMSRPCRRAS